MTTSGDGDDRRTLEPRTNQQNDITLADGVADSNKSLSSDDDGDGRLSGTDDSGSEYEIDSGARATDTQPQEDGQASTGVSERTSRQGTAKGKDVLWREDLSNLLTPQTFLEQAQVRRRKRNREAARRSRQRQKEREQELVERQAQLSDRLRFLERELEEWRTINASNTKSNKVLIDPELVASDSQDVELAENINNVYALTMDTLHIIGELQLQLDEITKELNSMIG
ncbi:hypothetical protein IW140_005349 [Coemansia sp. RSA 1813]|nr:hypothetical protein EV178_005144 [Coemansia sp. RSA 1646]KAJ1769050.1 hypothetical protein LPJ74_004346 [Coemansia sp. RSA 1843]KAJ2086873.1 hypothetical protein IW138_005347 [Coemansia sp. RSA 986]KAJ2211689.1 hypothetical protein EV179_005305 [Coemansia sp. RSA 487]KAJ2565357.1 hypothetical protein IW140_005349 [Coemansia sp. RSA 1813]